MPADRIPDVVLISPYPRIGIRHGGVSGVASYTANLAHALAGAGAEVTVVAPVERGERPADQDGPVRVLRAFRSGVRALPSAVAAARRTRAPVIHLQHELFLYGGLSALPGLVGALLPRKRRGTRNVVTMHQVVDPGVVDHDFVRLHRIGAPRHAARLAISGVQHSICALSDAVIVHEHAFTSVLPNTVAVPHGVEGPSPIDRDVARDALDLGDQFVALCFGFVAPYKGLESAIEAARAAGPEVRLVIAGGPHPRVEPRHGYAAGLKDEYGDFVRFTGYVDDADVGQWFRAADVVVLPYPAPHASSGALALALAYETPVLASTAVVRTCGLPAEVAFSSPAELGARLRELAARPDAVLGLRRAVRPLGRERSWSSVARRHLDIYASVAA